MNRKWIMITLVVALALIVSACGSGTEEAAATPTAASSNQESSAAPEAPAVSAATPEAPATVGPPEDVERGPVSETAPLERNGMFSTPPEMEIDPTKYYYATMHTNRGEIRFQLFADRAPVTVNNFVFLARQGFYDDTTFHRVLEGFMAQGGDPTGTGTGGPGYRFQDEFHPGLVFDRRGLLAMANAGPGTNGSQFFITFVPTEALNDRHTIFGEVIEGDEVLDRITRRDPEQNPNFAGDTIYTVTIEETEASILPTPTPLPPTPTPYAPSGATGDERPLAEISAAERANYYNTAPEEMVIDPTKRYTATITTSQGVFVATLFAEDAPIAVNNFVMLANLGFYDETLVTFVLPDGVIIGSPDGDPLSDAGYRIPAEMNLPREVGVGALTYIPFQQLPDGTVLSSSSQILIALVDPPIEANARFGFFGEIVVGLDNLPSVTAEDTIESIVITSE